MEFEPTLEPDSPGAIRRGGVATLHLSRDRTAVSRELSDAEVWEAGV